MADTKIEWTHKNGNKGKTWNCIRGCSHESTGCINCYAEAVAYRFSGEGLPYEGLAKKVGNKPRWTGKIMLVEKMLQEPYKWKEPCNVFVNSMSDLFHKDVPFEFLDKMFEVMASTPRHTYMCLTKRPERMVEYFKSRQAPDDKAKGWLWLGKEASVQISGMNHIWLGVSVENQDTADKRIPLLLETPLKIKFLSCEPLLGKVDVSKWLGSDKVNWVIAGGESGHNARPMHPNWARSLRDQCQDAGVAFFFKQWGEYLPESQMQHRQNFEGSWLNKNFITFGSDGQKVVNSFSKLYDMSDGEATYKIGKSLAGRLLDGKEYSEFPEVVEGGVSK